MHAHKLATLSGVIFPMFNFLRDTINHQLSMIICIITFLPAPIDVTTTLHWNYGYLTLKTILGPGPNFLQVTSWE